MLIVNDRADVALAVDAAGVHLGQDDLPVAAARALLGARRADRLLDPQRDAGRRRRRGRGADYLAFGPIFATTSKSTRRSGARLRAAARRRAPRVPLPLVAIGGITAATAADVLAAGADAVA